MDETMQAMNSGMNFGIMNAMRTGNPAMDILVCMMIPVILNFFMAPAHGDPMTQRIMHAWTNLLDWISGTKTYIRVIDHDDHPSDPWRSNTDVETTARNDLLQKAIKLHIQAKGADIDRAETYLVPSKTVKLERIEEYGDLRFTGSYEQLQSYGIASLPEKQHWVVVDSAFPAIYFRQTVVHDEVSRGNSSQKTSKTSYTLKCKGPKAKERVEGFINDAWASHKKQKAEEVDTNRYLYQLASKQDEDCASLKYKRYVLSDWKTFDTLFFPEKNGLIQLIDDFRNRTGKFSIPGYPNKLGLLLDGPPGTGKTSLIKALSIYLNRHIVSVSLEKVSTNEELMDMMFDLSFEVSGEDSPIKMKFEDIIFVMEDVDCASNVVYSRLGASGRAAAEAGSVLMVNGSEKGKPNPKPKEDQEHDGLVPITRVQSCPHDYRLLTDPANFRRSTPFNAAKIMREVSFTDSKKMPESDSDEEEIEAKETNNSDGADGADDLGDVVLVEGKDADKAKKSSLLDTKDKLNLSGLLNVLDGVVDAPGRVLIMTTNHPEKLDPALIRPGRINKRIHMGFVCSTTLLEMAKHYVCRDGVELPKNAKEEAARLCDGGRGISPAWIEQCAAESDDFPGLVTNLWKLKNAAATRRR